MTEEFKKLLKLFFLILLIWGLFEFLESDFFLIRKVNVVSENILIKEDILDKMSNLRKKSMIFVSAKKIRNILRTDVRIEEAKVIKKYPDTINIDIKETMPIALVQEKDRYFYINKNFNIFAHYEEIKDDILPIINLPNEENMNEFKLILEQVYKSKMYNIISEIYEKDKKYFFILIDGTIVYTNQEVKEKNII